jgi:hypothetical protein
MLRLCLLAYEQYQYHLVHQQMVAEGLLEALLPLPVLDAVDEADDDFEPEVIPGKPLSDIMLEERRSWPPSTSRVVPWSNALWRQGALAWVRRLVACPVHQGLYTAPLTEVEVRSALQRLVREGRLDIVQAQRLTQRVT